MGEKHYISANELLQDSFRLGLDIVRSGFRPDFIVGVWRGGTPVGIAVQEILQVCGISTDHIAIRTSSYSGIATRDKQVRVHGLEYLVDNVSRAHSVLLVDDVFDTGLSLAAVLQALQDKAAAAAPLDIRIATPWFKPANNRTDFRPHFYLHETDRWLVFPHELDGLTGAEIAQHKPGVKALLDEFALGEVLAGKLSP
ncbi:MAG: hypoxanthine phosphoribosyltransferase [Gammaproteobacteria bacterium]|uniref:phosphoribosyltransferase n=1 Tax=Pseudomaricurvus alcaniphilus TaxID=1166482 RepID=UPI001407DF7C|nr:phosphoribosyltransferase family protein [Pseudomaricurvus alcaniphilus]MBR9910735.1 hypoxanthine phosphoribosyltransferase [Gammaproteobacteria bacterium]NHN39074.1 hypoxanthine phosphoribosyltransferase [Pseudomaricurvus alcaniphilus]